MADLGDQERTIQGEAKECRGMLADTLVHLSRHDPLSIGIELQDELGRFNLWAGNIGVFSPLQASLDFRLADVPEIRSQFLRQLDTLSITLIQLNEAAIQANTDRTEDAKDKDVTREADISLLSDSDIVDLVQSIHVTIDWLHRLSNLVRKASFGSQNQRAARFPLEDEVGNDITESLAEIFKHLIKRECCDISDQILDRLAQTMITRRRRVLYRRSRQKRWALQQEAYRPRHLDPPTQLVPLEEADESVEDREGSEVTEDVKLEPENRVQAAPSRLTVTTLDQQKYRQLAAPSRISRATTAQFQHNEKLLVPPPPILAKEGREFVCDYCCLILPCSEAANQETWANHVKKDLDPYICVFDECSQPYQIYSSSKEWLAHMRSEHRMSWRCVVRDHPPQTFETREGFLDHMTQEHPGKFRKEQLPFIAESSARALSPTVTACPFCAEDSGDLENHVARHLCHFALQSLPWPDHLDQDSVVISGQEVNSSTSENVERETLKDDLDNLYDFIPLKAAEWLSLEPEEPLLDTPVSWPNIGRVFPETDQVLSKFAAHAASRAEMAPDDNRVEPETLDEELRQVKEQFPGIVLNDADMENRLVRASLRGPWGVDGENVVLDVKIDVPRTYPRFRTPEFHIAKDSYMPEWVRDKLLREVHRVCQLQLGKPCLAAAFAYLLGLRDVNYNVHTFSVFDRHPISWDTVDGNFPASSIAQQDAMKLTKVAENNKATELDKPEFKPKCGYLTKRGKNFGAWKSRFYVIDGPQLKYYDAEGGAQLGSIELHGAEMGKLRQDDTASDIDKQYDHAILIIEPKRGSEIKHVLCAESDEERDLWVEALWPWTNNMNSEEVKTAAHDPPSMSEFQTSTPQPSTFLLQVSDKSGQFRPVDHPGPHINISSAKIAGCSIDCRLNVSRTEFGTIEGLPGGIIYMDIAIGTPHKSLKSLTIMVVLHDKDPDLQRAVPVASVNAFETLDSPVVMTEFYGPKTGVIRGSKVVEPQNPRFQREAEALGTGFGAIGAVQDPTWASGGYWKVLSHLSQSKNSRLYRGVCWEIIPSDMDATSVHARQNIHTGFLFQSGGQAFSLNVGIKGKSSKISDRLVARANRNPFKWQKILLNWSNGHLHRPLGELARALPQSMNIENGLEVPHEISNAHPVQFGTATSLRGSDEYLATQDPFDSSIWGDAPLRRVDAHLDIAHDSFGSLISPVGPFGRTSTEVLAPSITVQSEQSSEADYLVDQSAWPNSGDRDNQQKIQQALKSSVRETGHDQTEEGFQGPSDDDFLHDNSHVEKAPINDSNLRSGEQAQRSMIPRSAGKRDDTKKSKLVQNFEQLSREFERQRNLDRRQKAANIQSRTVLPRTPARAIVEVYADASEAALEPGPSYHDHAEADSMPFSEVEGGPAAEKDTSTVKFTDTMKSSNTAAGGAGFLRHSSPDTVPEWPSSPRMRRASQKVAPRLPRAYTFTRQRDKFCDGQEHVQSTRKEGRAAPISRDLHDYQSGLNSAVPPVSVPELEVTEKRSSSTSSSPEDRLTGTLDYHGSQ